MLVRHCLVWSCCVWSLTTFADTQIQQVIPLRDIPEGTAKWIETEKASVWILHRSPEQIASLEQRSRTPLSPQNKRWGVFILWRDQGETMLRQGQNFYPCQKLEYFSNKQMVKGGAEWVGGLYCAQIENKSVALKDAIFIYDLAGNPRFKWLDPLKAPDYRITETQIELGKQP